MNIKVVVFALVMTASMGVQGESLDTGDSFETGSSILETCESEVWYNKGYCSGYIIGVSDTADTLALWDGSPVLICIPDGVTAGQLWKVVVKYLNENPEKLHFAADSLVLAALEGAFPCE